MPDQVRTPAILHSQSAMAVTIPAEYGKSINSMTKSGWWAGSDAWQNWFIQNAPGVERHKYLFPDEPDFKGPEGAKGTGSMDTIRMQAKWSHSNPGTGKNIPTLGYKHNQTRIKGICGFLVNFERRVYD